MRVRPATLDDASRIAEIHVRSWQEGYRGLFPAALLDSLSVEKRVGFWEERLTRGDATVLVAILGDEVVGWLACGAARDEDADPADAEVYGLYVHPDAWRSGAGSALWREAVDLLAAGGVRVVTLWVLEGNLGGRAFYESVGFVPDDGLTKEFRKDGVVRPEVRYRWNRAAPSERVGLRP